MTPIAHDIYPSLASRLLERLEGVDFFNGTVECPLDEGVCTLTATLIVYRHDGRINDIVPVWWQFSVSDGLDETPADLSWDELREYLNELI